VGVEEGTGGRWRLLVLQTHTYPSTYASIHIDFYFVRVVLVSLCAIEGCASLPSLSFLPQPVRWWLMAEFVWWGYVHFVVYRLPRSLFFFVQKADADTCLNNKKTRSARNSSHKEQGKVTTLMLLLMMQEGGEAFRHRPQGQGEGNGGANERVIMCSR
jgi:hypothetical protein